MRRKLSVNAFLGDSDSALKDNFRRDSINMSKKDAKCSNSKLSANLNNTKMVDAPGNI
jgi:hypothetical protein